MRIYTNHGAKNRTVLRYLFSRRNSAVIYTSSQVQETRSAANEALPVPLSTKTHIELSLDS